MNIMQVAKNYLLGMLGNFWADVMLRQNHIQASRPSPAGFEGGFIPKTFLGQHFLEDSFGQCIFKQYARETNFKKKRSLKVR